MLAYNWAYNYNHYTAKTIKYKLIIKNKNAGICFLLRVYYRTKTNHHKTFAAANINLAKQDDGLNESPTVMVVETNKKTKFGKNRGILKPIWAFVKTNTKNHCNIKNNFINEFNLTLHSQYDFIRSIKIQ